MPLWPKNNCNHSILKHPKKETFNIYHKVSCKNNYVIYLLECLLCKMQYIRKSKTPVHTRLNKHKNNVVQDDTDNEKQIQLLSRRKTLLY